MSVSGKELDRQADELLSLCPVLQPGLVPQGYDDADLQVYAEAEGESACEALADLVANAARTATVCCTCGAGGRPALADDAEAPGSDDEDDEGDGDEASQLHFTTFSRLSFADKRLTFTHAGFACGRCRAMRDVRRFVHFAALRLGPAHPDREALALELCAHFVTTNRVSDAVQSNHEAHIVWVQEVYSRAYALQVVASNIHGWSVVGPDGGALKSGVAGTATALASMLLSPPKAKLKRDPAAPVLKKKKKTKRKAPAGVDDAPEKPQPAATPARKRRVSKRPPPAEEEGVAAAEEEEAAAQEQDAGPASARRAASAGAGPSTPAPPQSSRKKKRTGTATPGAAAASELGATPAGTSALSRKAAADPGSGGTTALGGKTPVGKKSQRKGAPPSPAAAAPEPPAAAVPEPGPSSARQMDTPRPKSRVGGPGGKPRAQQSIGGPAGVGPERNGGSAAPLAAAAAAAVGVAGGAAKAGGKRAAPQTEVKKRSAGANSGAGKASRRESL